MSQGTEARVADEYEFEYVPDQSISNEQRIEVLEAELAEMRDQVNAILELLYNGRTARDFGSPWD